MTLKENEVYYCPVCGAEVKVIKNGENTAPLTCCGVDMQLK